MSSANVAKYESRRFRFVNFLHQKRKYVALDHLRPRGEITLRLDQGERITRIRKYSTT